jgi:hypothetical protein
MSGHELLTGMSVRDMQVSTRRISVPTTTQGTIDFYRALFRRLLELTNNGYECCRRAGRTPCHILAAASRVAVAVAPCVSFRQRRARHPGVCVVCGGAWRDARDCGCIVPPPVASRMPVRCA